MSVRPKTPPEMELGRVVYSENFGGSKVGIIRQSGITGLDSNRVVTGTVSYFDKDYNSDRKEEDLYIADHFVQFSGTLHLLNGFIGSPLRDTGTKIEDSRLIAASKRYLTDETGKYRLDANGEKIIKSKADELEDTRLILGFLLDAQENKTIKQNVQQLQENNFKTPMSAKKTEPVVIVTPNEERIDNYATRIGEWIQEWWLKQQKEKDLKPKPRVMRSRKSVAEMISARYYNSSSSDEDSEYKEANGRRSRRHKSRHHKKTNSRQKSNRHHKKSNRRQKSNRRRKSNRHKMHPRKK
jgi:hypothetical protein